MDEIDRKILAELQQDGRLTVTELADRVRLTPAPCHRRLRELERTGVITGYRAVLDPAAVGLGFEALVSVTMDREDADTIAAFETLRGTLVFEDEPASFEAALLATKETAA